MKEIMIASANAAKIKEFKAMLAPLGYEVKSLLDLNDAIDIEESGTTFAENALIKARGIHALMHIPVIADDSGLAVDAMDGAPGVYSARFMGRDTDYETKNRYIIKQCEGKDRGAQFICAIAYVDGEEEQVFEGVVEGSIAEDIIGDAGFGYDPIFYYEPFHTTLANVTEEEKNRISHRAKALEKLLAWMEANQK